MSIKPTTWEEVLASPVYIINMDKSTERLALAQKRIQDAGFQNIRRLSAVDATDTTVLLKEWGRYHTPPPRFDTKRDPEFMQYPGKQGCFLSHVKLWREMIEHTIPYVLVFEDDIKFHPNWNPLAEQYFKNTPSDWELIYLGGQMDFSSQFHIDEGPMYCTHAMMLTLSCAKSLYHALYNRKEGVYTIDNMFHDMQLAKTFPTTYYIWNATMYPCKDAYMDKGWTRRNHGLVFQDETLGSYIKDFY